MNIKYGLLYKPNDVVDSEAFQEMIAINAYYRAEKRGLEPNHEIDDWIEAEQDITNQLLSKPK
ncbi:MAG: DUF2934 domain-containing protein [Methylococcales bacterium]